MLHYLGYFNRKDLGIKWTLAGYFNSFFPEFLLSWNIQTGQTEKMPHMS